MPHLVYQRGHNRLPCFYDGEDYATFREMLMAQTQRQNCQLLAWSAIPDAYWLLLTPKAPNGTGKLVQALGRLYVRHINNKYRRTGSLWEGRYRACLIEPESSALRIANGFIQSAAYRNMVVSEGDAWPWQEPAASGDYENDSEAIIALERALMRGLPFGSEAFLQEVASASGLRTAPLAHGRPRKTTKSDTR